ncbi:MAG TPA: fructosamine kinase family protein [Chitinophagaceae bacterium]
MKRMGNLLPNKFMQASFENYITHILSKRSPVIDSPVEIKSVGGGSINETYQVIAKDQKFFCKVNDAAEFPGLFEKEAMGLQTISSTGCILCPEHIGTYDHNGQQILLLEWIETGTRTDRFWKRFGEQLAKLHLWKGTGVERYLPSNPFGFKHDNYMGSLPQKNEPMDNWCDFFRENRLQQQLNLALQQHLIPINSAALFSNLYLRLTDIFLPEPASLLHGDLWSGNFMCNENADPVLIDPAVYFGHRSMDLAMTTLFGGFDKVFYDAYEYWYPLPSNYKEQWEVCNLYPLLIHLNLFGKSYLPAIESCLRRFH